MTDSGWIDAFGVTATTVATGRPEVHPVLVADGALLVDLRSRGVHQVNTTAAAVFALCDGELDVSGIADELAGIYGVDASEIVDDLLGTVAQYAALGLVSLDDEAATAGEPAGEDDLDPRYVPAPCSPCQDNIDAYGWGPTVALAAGEKILGVRGHDAATSDLLRARHADRVVDDPDAPPNFSVVLIDDADPPEGPHRRSGLYERHLFVSSDLDHDGILELLDRRLRQHDPLPAGRVRLQATALVGDQGAVLLPWQGQHPDPALAAAAERPGWRLVAAPVELVATDSSVAVAVDDDAIVPLVGFVGSAPETTRLTPADAAVAVVGLVLPSSDAAAGDELQAVVDLADRIPVVGTTPDKQGDVATALVRAR